METHPANADLAAYLAGALDQLRDAEIEAHLTACDSDCVARLRTLEDAREQAREPGPPPLALRILTILTAHGAGAAAQPTPVVPGYEIETSPIGHGGMGVVYLAYHDDFGVVALKTIKTGLLATPEQIDRFRREMAQAKTMSDRADDQCAGRRLGSVRVFEVGEHDGVLFLSMELAAGGSVKSRLADLKENPSECARLVEPVARALHVMHESGGVHRDVTPGNILLQLRPGASVTDAARPPLETLEGLLSDYGLARQTEIVRGGQSETFCGTHAYLAPELLRSDGDATPASDVYALGATIYHMLSGDAPFGGVGSSGSPKELFDRISAGHPSPPASRVGAVPSDLDTICLKCLERNPKRRYATAQELADDLRRFRNGERIAARRVSAARRVARWCGKNRALVVTLTVLLLTLAATTAIVSSLSRERDLARARAAFANEQRKRDSQIAHDANVQAARSAVRRGDWSMAIRLFGSAIRDAREDATALRAERLLGYFAMGDEASLSSELAALETAPDLGRLAAHVAMVHGAFDLCDSSRVESGRALLQKALASRQDLTFSAADPEFAMGLADPRLTHSLAHLKEAVRLDPLHFTAQTSLLVALIAVGDMDEARRRAELMQGLFPGAARPDLILAIAEVIEGNPAAMRSHLNDLAQRAGPEKAAPLKKLSNFCESVAETLGVFVRSTFKDGGPAASDALKLRAGVIRMRLENHDAVTPFAFPAPTVGLLFGWVDKVLSAWMLDRGLGEEDYRKLVALADEIPDALVISLAARNRLYALIGPLNRAEMDQMRIYLNAMIADSARAADAGTLVPRSPIRYHARILLMIGDLAVLKLTPRPAPEHVTRIRDGLHRLVADGRGRPGADREDGLNLLLMLLAAPVTKAQARDWRIDTPEGLEAFELRHQRLIHLLRTLVDDWLDDEPANKVAQHWSTELERLEKTNGLEL
jgi:Protein kinase domain